MKLKIIQLLNFEAVPRESHQVLIPENSTLLDFQAVPEGINMFYSCPDIDTGSVIEEFYILKPEQIIPEGARFEKLIELYIPAEEGSQVMGRVVAFPIFRKKQTFFP